MVRRVFISLIIAAFITFCVIFFLVLPKSEDSKFKSPHVVIIGLDGAGWNLIQPLLDKGELPNLNTLMKKGSHGLLRTERPVMSSVIWTSIATGKSMAKHGIADWTFIDKNNVRVPYRQSERRVKAFWNILGNSGWKVGIVNWFVTHPPEEVNGYMISEEFRHLARRDTSQTATTCPQLLQKKLQFTRRTRNDFPNIREEEHLPDFSNKKALGGGNSKLVSHYANFVVQEKIVELASLYMFQRDPVDIFAAYFRLIDVVSHFACGYMDASLLQMGMDEEKRGAVSPETLDRIDRAYSEIMKPIYAYSDRILGRFLEMIDSKTNLIVVSDHGFGFNKGGYGHTNLPEIPHGIIVMKGPNIKSGYSIQDAHIYDIVPTVLYLFGMPVAKDMDGKVITEALDEKLLQKRPVRYIESYENESHETKVIRNKKIDEKVLEKFRALGYIEK